MAISGDIAIVGAGGEDAGGGDSGAAYVFERSQGGPNNWGEVKKLTASDAQVNDFFGISVAASGDTAVVGAFLEDAGGSNAGAEYVFQEPPPTPTATDTPTPTATPPPGQLPLGGSGVFPDTPGADGSSGLSYRVLAGIFAAVTAGALALGGAAWYARRRRRSAP